MPFLLSIVFAFFFETAIAQSSSPQCPPNGPMHNCQGEYMFPSGNKFRGEWKDGKLHGPGEIHFANGVRLIGNFSDSSRKVDGTLYFANGAKHVGEFLMGKPHGNGTQYRPDGSVAATGNWKDGVFERASNQSIQSVPTQNISDAQNWAEARRICVNYGFTPNTNPFAECVQREVHKQAVTSIHSLIPLIEPLKAAWIYVGPVGDSGWSFAHDLGRKAVEAKFGDAVKTTYVEKVPEGSEAELVIRDLANQGNKIIFATAFGYMDAMLKVAAEFPNVKFEHATGYKTARNMRIYDARFYQDSYMAGIIAGRISKTNVLGYVGSFPIPEVLRNINAFTLGAQSVNPKIRTKVVWVNTWFDPSKESEAAQSLINQKADVLLQSTDSTAVLQTAEKNQKYAFGWDSDMSAYAPNAHLASAAANWGQYYITAIQEVKAGTWKAERTVWGVKEGLNDLIKIADVVPEDAKKRVQEIKAGMKDGSFEVFTGPIMDNTGKVRLPTNQKADQRWKDSMEFYVMGVEGRVPDSNLMDCSAQAEALLSGLRGNGQPATSIRDITCERGITKRHTLTYHYNFERLEAERKFQVISSLKSPDGLRNAKINLCKMPALVAMLPFLDLARSISFDGERIVTIEVTEAECRNISVK